MVPCAVCLTFTADRPWTLAVTYVDGTPMCTRHTQDAGRATLARHWWQRGPKSRFAAAIASERDRGQRLVLGAENVSRTGPHLNSNETVLTHLGP